MASSWGNSWAISWGLSWEISSVVPPIVVVPPAIPYTSGDGRGISYKTGSHTTIFDDKERLELQILREEAELESIIMAILKCW